MIRNRLMILSGLLSFFFPAMMAVDPNCNYYQNMEVGSTYYVYNPEYPYNYPKNRDCLWIAKAPNDYQIEIDCTLEMPQSKGCIDDQLKIALNGDESFQDAHPFCGNENIGPFYTQSNKIAISLKSSYSSTGGRFLCTMKTKTIDPSQCDCGLLYTNRIVGGTETRINEFTMMGALVDLQIRDLFCGATIIASRYALSAAHCIKEKVPQYTGLLVGEHNVSSGTETGAAHLYRINQFISHPQYDPNEQKGYNDIAVLKTEKNIEFNMQVGPACLPFTNYQNSFAGDIVKAMGWGTTEFTGPKSDVLLKTDLDVLGYNDCYNREGGIIDQMCTYRPGHDSCQSDSGGPLLWKDKISGRVNVVGIISSGYGCASTHAALNTRVTSYLMWITSVTQGAEYCVK